MNINVLTLFPEMFRPILDMSILGRAQSKKLININLINIRDFSKDKHKRVDDYPYGGGKGMLITCQPIFDALEFIETNSKKQSRIIYLSPKGKTFNQRLAIELSKETDITLICGHYEGIDQRIIDTWVTDEISIGDYVLSGGEIPALVIIDSIARLVPGVLPDKEAYEIESFYNGLLEFPQYTRPYNYKGNKVPDILLSGNHKLIEEWRFEKSIEITIKNRPDLIKELLINSPLRDNIKEKVYEILSRLK